MNRRIVFLADAGAGVGWGHVYRLLPVYEQMKDDGLDYSFFTPTSCRISHVTDERMGTFPEDVGLFSSWAHEKSPDIIVVDSYRHHELLRNVMNGLGHAFRIVQFDDHYRPIDTRCVIVNAAPDASRQRYGGFGCADKNLLLGPRFVSLAEAFGQVSGEIKTASPEIRKILVALGGSDTESHLGKLLTSLAGILPAHVEVAVVGDADTSGCDARVKAMGWLDQRRLASLMVESDLAVFAGGSMMLQAMSLGLPVLSWPQTQNQRRHAQAWEACGCVALLDDVDRLAPVFASLQKVEHRQALRDKGRAMIDGKGAWRIASHIRALIDHEVIC